MRSIKSISLGFSLIKSPTQLHLRRNFHWASASHCIFKLSCMHIYHSPNSSLNDCLNLATKNRNLTPICSWQDSDLDEILRLDALPTRPPVMTRLKFPYIKSEPLAYIPYIIFFFYVRLLFSTSCVYIASSHTTSTSEISYHSQSNAGPPSSCLEQKNYKCTLKFE